MRGVPASFRWILEKPSGGRRDEKVGRNFEAGRKGAKMESVLPLWLYCSCGVLLAYSTEPLPSRRERSQH